MAKLRSADIAGRRSRDGEVSSPPAQKQHPSPEDRQREEVLAVLAELGGKLTAEEDVEFRGTKIVLPETMELNDAIDFLVSKLEADDEQMSFMRTFNYRPWDGARATDHALRKAFGMSRQKATMSWFGPIPPRLISVPTGPRGQTEQVPWGEVVIPILPGCTFTLGSYNHQEMGMLFMLSGLGPRKYRFQIEGIFRLVDEELKTNSMYRGKAFDGQQQPQFLDLTGVNRDKVIYSEETVVQLEANLWSLLRHTETMRSLDMPLKRAVLLEGPFGTGKTLAAYLTAQVAVQEGWTFVYCRPTHDNLSDVMATAQLYQPAVVFFEDVDKIADGLGEDSVGQLLDTFDGIQAKGTELVAVLTTNHKERIHKAMVRPGRLDAVIHIGDLDRNGVERLVRSAVKPVLLDDGGDGLDFDVIYEAMEGFLPAFCKEAVDRALRYSIARGEGQASVLSTEDFVHAARGLRPQLDLMEGAGEGHDPDALSQALGQSVRQALTRTPIVVAGESSPWAHLVPTDEPSQS